jgi:hypothetical protein
MIYGRAARQMGDMKTGTIVRGMFVRGIEQKESKGTKRGTNFDDR